MPQKKSLIQSLVKLLARRDYSRAELIEKLSKDYSFNEIQEALDQEDVLRLLKDDHVLAQRLTATLHERGKGINYINWKLSQKGLPSLALTENLENLELEKALRLVENKFDWAELQSRPQDSLNEPSSTENGTENCTENCIKKCIEKCLEKKKSKVKLFLAARGFDQNVVRKVLYEKFRST